MSDDDMTPAEAATVLEHVTWITDAHVNIARRVLVDHALAMAAPIEGGEEPGRAMLRQIVDPVVPEPCPGGCECRWREDADRRYCGCDGPCTAPTGEPDPEWEARPDVPDDAEDVLYSLNDLRTVLGHPDLSLEHALAAAANRLRVPTAPPAEGEAASGDNVASRNALEWSSAELLEKFRRDLARGLAADETTGFPDLINLVHLAVKRYEAALRAATPAATAAPEIVTGEEAAQLPVGSRLVAVDADLMPRKYAGIVVMDGSPQWASTDRTFFVVMRAPEPAPTIKVGQEITTAAQLDACPDGAVIRSLIEAQSSAEKIGGGWSVPGVAETVDLVASEWLPARVLDLGTGA